MNVLYSWLFGIEGGPSHCHLEDSIIVHVENMTFKLESSKGDNVILFAGETLLDHFFLSNMVKIANI